MELLQLKYFQTVAKLEHMTRASEELYITQPSLSKVISRLEEDLGVQLFDRHSRNISLNRYGKAFLKRVERVFSELDKGRRELSDMLENDNSRVSIVSNQMSLFPKLLEGYLKLYPQTHFQHTIGSISEMKMQLERGSADFCISSPPVEGTGIECLPLYDEEIFMVVPKEHKFAKYKSIKLIEAAEEPFISLKEGFGIRDLTERYCHEAGFTPNVVFESDQPTKLIDFVSIRMGITLHPIPPWSNLPGNDLTVVHIQEPKCCRSIGLSFLKDSYMTQVAKQFKEYILNYFLELGKTNV